MANQTVLNDLHIQTKLLSGAQNVLLSYIICDIYETKECVFETPDSKKIHRRKFQMTIFFFHTTEISESCHAY